MKTAYFTLVALLSAGTSFSQTTKHKRSIVEWGINFGVNYSWLHAPNTDPSKILQLSTVNGMVYRLGLVSDIRVSKHLSVQLKPEFSLNDSRMSFTGIDNSKAIYEMPPTVEVAAHLTYKLFKHTFRPYVLAGPAYKIPLPGASSTDASQISRSSVSLDIGAGLERKFKKFTLMPEIRYGHGISNMSGISSVNTLKLHSVILCVNFKR